MNNERNMGDDERKAFTCLYVQVLQCVFQYIVQSENHEHKVNKITVLILFKKNPRQSTQCVLLLLRYK